MAEAERILLFDARIEDIQEVASLEGRAFPVPWKRSYFEAEVGQPFRFNRVARDRSGELAGYLFCAFAAGEIHVHKIAVTEAWRRRGVARLLMADLFSFAERTLADVVYLEVRPSNTPARIFYANLGFAEVGRRPRYYLDGEDALVLSVAVQGRTWLDGLRSKRGDSGSAVESNTK